MWLVGETEVWPEKADSSQNRQELLPMGSNGKLFIFHSDITGRSAVFAWHALSGYLKKLSDFRMNRGWKEDKMKKQIMTHCKEVTLNADCSFD